MNTGRQFNADLGAWARKAGDKMDALARQTAQEVSFQVVNKTPVDTGFLRSSWQPAIGGPKPSNGAPGAQSKPIGEIGLVAAGLKAGEMYWMTNGAKYASFVEFGTSRMAGRFMVTDTVSRWGQIVERVARDLKMK